jgi:3-hydroxyacyl-CoA dehydrogenase/enoyl-CoA hydratase/3-hydroxybutyryl-CoA epimerase
MSDQPAVRYERGEDGVVVLTMDDPEQSANTLNRRWAASFAAALDRLDAEQAEVTGVIVTSAKKTFCAGGDLGEMRGSSSAAAASDDATAGNRAAFESVEGTKVLLRRLEKYPRPVVAAVNGAALGGGLEVALACHHRVALDVPSSRFGFPEVTLGLLPGAGGVVRTVRMLGIAQALTGVLLEGKRFRPAKALELGLVDEVVATPDEMFAAARAWIAANPEASQPWDRKGYRMPGGSPSSPSLAAMLPMFPATLRKQSKGAPFPAPRAILSAAVEGASVDFDTASRIESRYFVSLLNSQVARNMIKAFFFDMQAITSGASRPDGYETWTPSKVVVLGAGMMGAGIAYECARAGWDVVLKDVDLEAAGRGKAYSEKVLGTSVSRGHLSQADADAVLARITPTASVSDAAGADLMIEAVFEGEDLKKQVYGETEPQLAPGALLASNTSTLPITGLAEGVSRPEDFIGLHFFSPVDKMNLIEIIVGERTSDATLARAFDVARALKKTPIVVNDSRGFFTSRVIGRFIEEAFALVAEGVPAPSVEQAALQAGYPTGPLALADELNLRLMQRIRGETPGLAVTPGQALVDQLVSDGRAGRLAGAGFYDYADGRRSSLWPGLKELETDAGRAIPFRDLQERMLFAEALDAVRCKEEGVIRSDADANVGSILGIGFPAWTGGVAQYVEQYAGGPAGFAARARELAATYGDRFTPPPSLPTEASPAA